jgi:uncharacterized membrane protein
VGSCHWLKHPNLTRAGFYTLTLGALGAGIAALSGPDHASGDPSVPLLLAWHQNFASLTVGLAVVMFAVRFLSADGLRGRAAIAYLVGSLVLLFAVSMAGYYGGEMTYHHAVGVVASGSNTAGQGEGISGVSPWVPTKPFVALLGFLCIVGIVAWLTLGRTVAGSYYDAWWRAVRQELANAYAPLWTLQRGRLPDSLPSMPNPPALYATSDERPLPSR